MALFSPGRLTATPRALAALGADAAALVKLLERHFSGDWGEVCAEDAALNDAAVRDGSRILSAYGDIWIITEADRSVTTVLLKSEY